MNMPMFLTPEELFLVQAYRAGMVVKQGENPARSLNTDVYFTKAEVHTTGDSALDVEIETFVVAHEGKLLNTLKRYPHQDGDVLKQSIYDAVNMLKALIRDGAVTVKLDTKQGRYAAMKLIFSLAKGYNATFE